MRAPRRLRRALLAGLAGLAWSPAFGQGLRPGDERPELPAPLPESEEAPRFELPPLPPPTQAPLSGGLRVPVERFEILGSTVFDPATLAAAVAPFTGRAIQSDELLLARDALTRLYREAGYATSGAIIPDQDVAGGVVTLQVIEGALVDVEVSGNRHFRSVYFEQRLLLAGRAPVNVERLERALQVLQRDPWIERLEAVLEPGARRGESRLRLRVVEARPYRLRLTGANDRSPAVGSAGGGAEGAFVNAIGLRDVLSARYEQTAGLIDVEGRYELPVTPWDTRLRLRYRNTWTEIVEEPFDDLDIQASSWTAAVGLAQPLLRSDSDELWLTLDAEYRTTHTEVLGQSFCFEPQTPDCDDPTVSVLRSGLDWTRRTRSDVFALRSLLSFGLDVLGATQRGDADGTFVAWLAQGQWAHVLPESLWSTQSVLRADLQLASDPLLSIERFAIGGRYSVRGYRENQLVRDSGVTLSGELRIPVWRDSLRRPILELVPFMDYGQGWNEGPQPPDDTLWSLGVGARFTPTEWLLAEVYWGGRLEKVPNPHDVLQDEGVHLRIAIDAF